MGPPISKIDFGRGSGKASLPSVPRNPQTRGEGPSSPAPGPPERPSRDLGPITNPRILERKALIDRLTAEMHGMLMIDRPHDGIDVDLDRMMYMYREGS